ncbi:MAG: helix-turn-helix transcriptional regulator, partial [Simkania sp.]|nr:helix-turn-helix transcriptional regulator [Simkania sp.]
MKDFLFRKNLTVKKFAGDLGISPSYLYQLLRGERKPSLQLAHKIEKY